MNHTHVIRPANVSQSRLYGFLRPKSGQIMDWLTLTVLIAAAILATLAAVAAFEYDRDTRHRP